MGWFVIALPLVTTLFVAVMLLLMPSVTRPTVPLGVSIPQGRVGEPVVREAVKRYRWGVGVAVAVSVAATLVLAAGAPIAAVIAPLGVLLLLSLCSYLFARRRIQRVKQSEMWYQDVPVRLRATLTASGPASRTETPILWYVAGIAVLGAVAAVGVGIYDSLPRILPVHWNSEGIADRLVTKSVWAAFGPLLIGMVLVAFLFAVARMVNRIPVRQVADYTREQQAALQQLMQSMIGQITLIIAIMMGALSLQAWFAPGDGTATMIVSILAPVLIFALIGLCLVRMRRLTHSTAARVGAGMARDDAGRPGSVADTPDDDRYWKGGMFYANRNDPALWVPKRFGVGWTVNLGHPGGIAIIAAVVLVIVGLAVFVPGS